MAFLEIVTRCYKRPVMLKENIASLKAQTDSDWTQSFIVDNVGCGVGWSYDQLAKHPARGEYVWLLDDDDMCTRPTLVEELKAIAAAEDPDVMMIRMDHGPRGVLPCDTTWGLRPIKGRIGCSAYIIRRSLWLHHRQAFMPGHYASDFDFITSVFDAEPRIYWHDVVASRVQRISLGAPE